jgi:uncharacterized LabA/DUF88 family protein
VEGRGAVYVDAFNLYYGSLRGTPYRWLNLDKLCDFLLPELDIRVIRYFTAIVESRPDDPRQQQRQQAYLRALATLPKVTVHYGFFLTKRVRLPLAESPLHGPRTVEVLRTEEKGSDVNLATHLLADGFRGDYDVATVISNDSDLQEPITVVRKDLGLRVGIVNPDATARRSALPGDFHRRIRERQLRACQFPSTIRDPHGVVRRPVGW